MKKKKKKNVPTGSRGNLELSKCEEFCISQCEPTFECHLVDMSSLVSPYDFGDNGFKNIVVKEENDNIVLRTNVKNEQDVEKWRNAYSKNFNSTLNVMWTYKVQRFAFHRRYICIFGDKRHKGIRKTFTG